MRGPTAEFVGGPADGDECELYLGALGSKVPVYLPAACVGDYCTPPAPSFAYAEYRLGVRQIPGTDVKVLTLFHQGDHR